MSFFGGSTPSLGALFVYPNGRGVTLRTLSCGGSNPLTNIPLDLVELCPGDVIGNRVCFRSKILGVRVSPGALDFISKYMQDWSNGKTRDSKPFNVGSIPTSCALPS